MPSKFNSTAKKPGKAVKKPYNRGGRTAAIWQEEIQEEAEGEQH